MLPGGSFNSAGSDEYSASASSAGVAFLPARQVILVLLVFTIFNNSASSNHSARCYIFASLVLLVLLVLPLFQICQFCWFCSSASAAGSANAAEAGFLPILPFLLDFAGSVGYEFCWFCNCTNYTSSASFMVMQVMSFFLVVQLRQDAEFFLQCLVGLPVPHLCQFCRFCC